MPRRSSAQTRTFFCIWSILIALDPTPEESAGAEPVSTSARAPLKLMLVIGSSYALPARRDQNADRRAASQFQLL